MHPFEIAHPRIRLLPVLALAGAMSACGHVYGPKSAGPTHASTTEPGTPPPAVSVSTPPHRASPAGQPDQVRSTDDLPYFGFNAKGPKDVDEQTAMTNDLLGRITDAATRQRLVIRVTGGTISQTTYGRDWTAEMISQWVALQKKQGVRFVFVVNGNEAPADQAALIQRWLDAGAEFDFIEMMNEYYLPKFARGDRSHEAVTRAVTPESYVNEILPAYWRELDRFKLPYYVIFAPVREQEGAQVRNEPWNRILAHALNNTYRQRDLHATVHLYVRDNNLEAFDYGQIDRLRAMLPAGRRIAVTEAGILDDTMDNEQVGRLTVAHFRNIMRHLHAGDYLMDQVLYNPSTKNNTADTTPNGITPKGAAIVDYIRGGLK